MAKLEALDGRAHSFQQRVVEEQLDAWKELAAKVRSQIVAPDPGLHQQSHVV